MDLNQKMAENSVKIWTSLFAIGGIFFSIIGAVMLSADLKSISGGQYVITSLLLFITSYFVFNHRINMNLIFTKSMLVFTLGFMLNVVGAGSNTDIWTLGFLLYVTGIYHAVKR